MPLKLRPTGLGSWRLQGPPRLRRVLRRVVHRPHLQDADSPELRWFWALHAPSKPGEMRTSNKWRRGRGQGRVRGVGRGWQSGVTASATALSTAAYPLRMPRRTQRRVLRCRVTNPIKEALTALADVLAKRPAEEILFEWFRSGRLVGELSVRITLHEPTTVSHLIDRPIHLVDWMAGSCLPPGVPARSLSL